MRNCSNVLSTGKVENSAHRAKAKFFARAAFSLAVVWTVYLLKGNVWFRLYPALMAAFFFMVFAVSLFTVPAARVFAEAAGEKLDEAGIRYCRKATAAWTVFLGVHAAVTLATVFMPLGVWAFYNGFLAYVLMAAMFLAEFAARKRARLHG